jgi:hypothetical protein
MTAHERPFALVMRIPLETIDAVVCAWLGPARVTGNAQPAAFNRQVAMYLAKHVGGWSTMRIGRFYNGRDHSTVCHSIRRIESMKDDNPELDALLTAMRNELRNTESPVPSADDGCHRGQLDSASFEEMYLERLVDRIVERVVERLGKRLSRSGAAGAFGTMIEN